MIGQVCDGSRECAAMVEYVGKVGAKGIARAVVFDASVEPIATKQGYVYRPMRGNTVIVLNYCPWCGAKIGLQPNKESES